MRFYPAFFAALLFLSPPAFADRPSLHLPVDCTLGKNCWTVHYVDTDPAMDAAKDFACGSMTYDEHHGTDFAIADLVTMETGIDVIAAANGTVVRTRDEIEDKIVTDEEREKLLAENRGCGNGVFIDHGDEWQTIYCHMKQGSIAVEPGQQVKAGDRLGHIGTSGIAEFPHVHFGVFHAAKTIDPFTGLETGAGACGEEQTDSLWAEETGLTYEPVALYAAGFKAGVPSFDAVLIDTLSPESLPANSPALVFWAIFYGAREGDRVTLEITDPQGAVFAQRLETQEKTRIRQFYYAGKKITDEPLVPGTYTGTISLTRDMPGKAPIFRKLSRTLLVE